ncbi:hypothetical protein [Variovorax rhizosphaerae]|uniref:DUF1311 domain-containing protein n=1 Tax=Variovorax rhizosphaerae TaxID=1836200 RepID=A0ABU8WVU6_9BURK
MKQHLFAIAIASALLALTGVQAMTKDEYRVACCAIEARYQGAKDRCDTLAEDAKDFCMVQAQQANAIARAELEQLYRPSPANARKVNEARTAAAALEIRIDASAAPVSAAADTCEHGKNAEHDMATTGFNINKG